MVLKGDKYVEDKEEETTDSSERDKEGDDVEKSSVIDEAKKVNETRLEIIDREEKLMARSEKLHAEQLVSGKGQSTEEKHEETPKEFSQRIMKGELTEDERARGQK